MLGGLEVVATAHDQRDGRHAASIRVGSCDRAGLVTTTRQVFHCRVPRMAVRLRPRLTVYNRGALNATTERGNGTNDDYLDSSPSTEMLSSSQLDHTRSRQSRHVQWVCSEYGWTVDDAQASFTRRTSATRWSHSWHCWDGGHSLPAQGLAHAAH